MNAKPATIKRFLRLLGLRACPLRGPKDMTFTLNKPDLKPFVKKAEDPKGPDSPDGYEPDWEDELVHVVNRYANI